MSFAIASPTTPPPTVAPPASSAVAAGASAGLAQSAVDISADEGVVATLGGPAPAGLTYDADGLLDSFVAAGTQASLQPAAGVPPQTTDQSLVSSLSGTSATGYVPASASSIDINARWSSVLQSAPGMAGEVVADQQAQGIVASLSAFA